MIVRLMCPICINDAIKRGIPAVVDSPTPINEVRDDGCYEVKCDAGHTARVALHNVKFEILFELALHALMDGYPREAVSSFTSSLERFYEFFWRAVSTHAGLSPDQQAEAWKAVANQSERQLGMYITSHLLLTKKAPALLNNTEVHFRNEVVHKGAIPSRGAAAKYGDAVFKLIDSGIAELRTHANDVMLTVYKELLPKLQEGTPDEIVGGANIGTMVSVEHPIVRPDDPRQGGVLDQFPRIARDRKPHRMRLLDEEGLRKEAPEAFEE